MNRARPKAEPMSPTVANWSSSPSMICGSSGGNTPWPKFSRRYTPVNQANAASQVRADGSATAATPDVRGTRDQASRRRSRVA